MLLLGFLRLSLLKHDLLLYLTHLALMVNHFNLMLSLAREDLLLHLGLLAEDHVLASLL